MRPSSLGPACATAWSWSKWVPAVEGHEGTMLSFGTQDHGALHGRYLVLRRWERGRSVEV